MRKRDHAKGFTLIELAVTLTVVVVLTLLALPSFQGMRQRAAIRGAAEEVMAFWNHARLEAARRNTMVKVGIVQANSGAQFCLGAATTTSATDTTPCDCRQATPGSNVCNVARFPENMTTAQAEWKEVKLAGVTLGGGTLLTNIEPAVFEPKRTVLTVGADDGTVSLQGPPGPFSYKLNVTVDKFGRAFVCESTASVHHLPEYADRRCAD
jgi:prepilin-type N-terminal cleavage/methylation domain-containing protein